ncbi:MAG: PAS domain-containing protein, partial [Deltaproteobacteria bacterium]|nr:PAS domain-containing protein [Deltaproteobacteria bacterium]
METLKLLESVFDAIPDVIGIQDRHHKIIRYNAAGYKFLNMTHKEIGGKKCYELIGRSTPCDICATTECYKTKKPARVEQYVEKMDVWLDVRAYPVLDMLERAVKQSIDGIAVADMDGYNKFVNPAWAQMHGYSVEELMGEHLSRFHPEEQLQEKVTPFLDRVIKAGSHQDESEHTKKDGTIFPTWMMVNLIKDEWGNPVGMVG